MKGSQNGHHPKRYKPRLYTITFGEDSEYADLEAKVRPASFDTLAVLMQVQDDARDAATGLATGPAQVKAVEVLIREFAGLIHWWNVDAEDENEQLVPVVPDEAGLRSQDFLMVMALFNAWSQRFAVVAPPLPQGSNGGPDTGIEALMPMETVSASPPS